MNQIKNLKTGIKHKDTPIGKIPVDWEVVRLGELAAPIKNAFSDGPFGSNLKLEDYVDSGIPVLQGKNITKNRLEWFDIRYVTKKKAKEHSRSLATIGDILMTKIGTVGCVAIVNDLRGYEYALIPANLMKITLDKNKVDTNFLYQFLLWPITRKRIVDFSSQTAQPALSLKAMKTFEIVCPSLSEQKKIAEILTTVDEAIERTDQIIEKTKEVKKGLMQKLLTRGIGQKKFKKTEIGKIPEEWEVIRLKDITQKFYNGGTPDTKIKDYWDGNIPWITGADFEGQKIKQFRRYITDEGVKNSATNVIPKGNLLVVTRTGVGKLAIAPFDIAISQDITGVILDSEKALPGYIYWYLNFKSNRLRSIIQGTSINGLLREDLESIAVTLPHLSEQKQIAEILSSVDEEIEKESGHKEQLETLKKGLMQVLLTGKIRVS